MVAAIAGALTMAPHVIPSLGVTPLVIESFLILAIGLTTTAGFAPLETALVQADYQKSTRCRRP